MCFYTHYECLVCDEKSHWVLQVPVPVNVGLGVNLKSSFDYDAAKVRYRKTLLWCTEVEHNLEK